MIETLTPKQQVAWRTVQQLAERRGYPPTVRELAAALGCHPNNAYQFILALERRGYLRRRPGARGIELVEPAGDAVRVPVVGAIAAGEPLDALAETGETLRLGRDLIGAGDTYVLRVRGNSMREDHILDGDLVVIRPQPTAENGDVVVALLADGTATLKRFYREDGQIRLQPANAAYQPLRLDPSAVAIQGKVIALLRRGL